MMSMRAWRMIVMGCVLVCASGCTDSGVEPRGVTAPAFEVREGASSTRVVARDAAGLEVARLELVHGLFEASEDVGGPGRAIVDGRKLTAVVGDETLAWETIGYTDTSAMPPLPPSLAAVAAFLSDERVRPILAKWRIGWRESREGLVPRSDEPEEPLCDYHHASYAGTNPRSCARNAAGIMQCAIATGTTQVCANGGTIAVAGIAVTEDAATWGLGQDIVAMCCGNAATGSYAVKVCPHIAPPPGGNFCGTCGCSVNRCQACFNTQPYANGCSLYTEPAGYDNAAGTPVTLICHEYACGAETVVPAKPTLTVIGPGSMSWECGTSWVDPGVSAENGCGGELAVTTTGSVDAGVPGTYQLGYAATDLALSTATGSRTVVVEDTDSPVVTTHAVTLWPPDRGMRAFTLADCATVSDACEGASDAAEVGVITDITSDEPGANQLRVTGPASFELRAERDGGGDGRVYTVDFEVPDPDGDVAATCRFEVPHDLRESGD